MVRVPLDKEELELTLEHESPTISPRSNAVNMKNFVHVRVGVLVCLQNIEVL